MNDKLQLLIVDDEVGLLEVVQSYCRRLGAQTVSAGSVGEALALFPSLSFDAVFSDIVMPDGSGVELLKRVRALKPDLPFIFWSGFWDKKVREEIRAFGSVYCIDKPLDMDQLKEALAEIRARAK